MSNYSNCQGLKYWKIPHFIVYFPKPKPSACCVSGVTMWWWCHWRSREEGSSWIPGRSPTRWTWMRWDMQQTGGYTNKQLNNDNKDVVNIQASKSVCTSTESPHGCVPFPLFVILYTDNCRSKYENYHIVKFADDSVIISLLSESDQTHDARSNLFWNVSKN